MFLETRDKYIKENRNFISIDETSFGRNYSPSYGYSRKGERIYIKRPYNRITTQSVVAAISSEKINYYKKEGSFNSDNFCYFLETLKYPSKSVLIMDNVSFHHSQKVKEVIKNKEWDILYIPPYSPIFNPIEGIFSIVKRIYKKCMIIDKSFNSVTNEHIKSFFKYSMNAISRF